MLIGFVHGVMNTDNMTISGETIDYGPCAFMEAYDPDTVFSSIDQWGRYAYDNQPVIAGWNLARFAEALLPLLADTVDDGVALAEKAFDVFRVQYDATWTDGMRAKLGLSEDVDAATVTSLAEELLALLKESRVDYTSFFRALSDAARGDAEAARGLFINLAGIDEWIARWRALGPDAAADGPKQPGLHPAQSSRRGGVDRGYRRRSGSAPAAAHCGQLLHTTSDRVWSVTPARRRKISATTGRSAAPELRDWRRAASQRPAGSSRRSRMRVCRGRRERWAGWRRGAAPSAQGRCRSCTAMINRLTRAFPPLMVITCWGLCSHPGQLKSGGRCRCGQLTLMEVMSPSNGVSAATRPGNSTVMRSTRGHHAPSMSPPKLAGNREPNGIRGPPVAHPTASRLEAKSVAVQRNSFTAGVAPAGAGQRRNPIARECHPHVSRGITADNETAHLSTVRHRRLVW